VGKGQFFSANGAGKLGYPHAKELSWTLTLCPIKNLVESESKT